MLIRLRFSATTLCLSLAVRYLAVFSLFHYANKRYHIREEALRITLGNILQLIFYSLLVSSLPRLIWPC